jgi:serine kinase of HPr protein (carbohydrate metabolism regulator)
VDGRLFAGAPPSLAGKMEIRGVGVVTLDACAPAPVILAVELDPAGDIARLPQPRRFTLPQALEACAAPPLLVLNPFEASAPAKIVAATSALARSAFIAGSGLFAADPFL